MNMSFIKGGRRNHSSKSNIEIHSNCWSYWWKRHQRTCISLCAVHYKSTFLQTQNKITLSKVTDAVIVFWSCVLIVMLYSCSPTTVSAIKNRALSTGSNNNNYDSQFNKVVSQFCSLYSLLGKCCQYSIADLLLFICCYRDRFWIHSCLLSATLTWAWIWKMTKLRT